MAKRKTAVLQTLMGSPAFALLAVAALSACGKAKCEACTQDSDCASGMICLPEVKVCRPKGDDPVCQDECLKSAECAGAGLCTLKGTRCAVGTDADCRRSLLCKNEGKCNRVDLGDFGTCVAVNPADCKSSAFCRTKGHCSVMRSTRECRALTDGDCSEAEVCTANGKCTALDGECMTEGS